MNTMAAIGVTHEMSTHTLIKSRTERTYQRGAAVTLVAFGLFTLIFFVLFSINAGSFLQRRVHAQTVADTAAVSAVTWTARELNMVSMVNVAMAMTMANTVMLKATFWTTNIAMMYAVPLCTFYCFAEALCLEAVEEALNLAVLAVQLDIDAGTQVIEQLLGFIPGMSVDVPSTGIGLEEAEDYLWDVMEDLSSTEATLADAMPYMAEASGLYVARTNGAAAGIVYPLPAAPLEAKGVTELCSGMVKGRKGGYESDIADTMALLVPTAPSSPAGPLYGIEMTPFQAFWGGTAPLYFANPLFLYSTEGRAWAMCEGENLAHGFQIYLSAEDTFWSWLIGLFVDVPDDFSFSTGITDFLTEWLTDPDADKAKPLMLTSDWRSHRSFNAYTLFDHKTTEAILAPEQFHSEVEGMMQGIPVLEQYGLVTLARAQVYNPYQSDTFTPQWRARLVPVSLDNEASSQEGSSSDSDNEASSLESVVEELEALITH